MSELLVSATADPNVQSKMEEVIRSKNDVISELHGELTRLRDAQTQMIGSYESKLAVYGIPAEELGFVPMN